MNKNVVWILVIVVLLCMCCAVGGVGAMFVVPQVLGDQYTNIINGLGVPVPGASLPSTTLPTSPASSAGKVQFPTSSSASSVAPSGTSSKASSAVSSAAPSGAGGIGGLLGSAANKAKTATKYRLQFTWVLGEMKSGKFQESPFIDMSGEMDNGKAHLTSKGGLLAMLGDANTPIEIIEADGKTYMKGVTMFGLTDPKAWYITDGSSTSGFADFSKPDEFSSFTGGTKDADFKKVRTEPMDGQSCDVYLYDMKSVQNAAILGMFGTAQDKNDFASVDKAEMTIWLCADGFVHQWTVDYQGHDAKDATQKGSVKMSGHMWDFNNPAITVTVPKDAKPMPGSK